jgi:hypothetical protein
MNMKKMKNVQKVPWTEIKFLATQIEVPSPLPPSGDRANVWHPGKFAAFDPERVGRIPE